MSTKIGTLRDDMMLFWGIVKMLAFILLAVIVVGLWTGFISTITLYTIAVVQGVALTPANSNFLNTYAGQVSGVVSILAIFTLSPAILARGYLFIPREEVLEKIHADSLEGAKHGDAAQLIRMMLR
ncbi:hypothetical protein FBR02_03445 [Anaerolineae bacterium CFX9]|nr:hypothetical protein [Anaerolineae bacterium CFX9]